MRSVTALLALAIAATPAISLGELKVEAFKVSESRSVQIKKLEKKNQFGVSSGLTVQLLISGAEVESFSHFGQVAASEAKDDTGQSLVQKQNFFGSKQFRELNRKQMWFFDKNPPKDQIKIDVRLVAPPRKATKIELLKGSLKLQSAKTNPVTFAAKVTKSIDNKLLKAAKVSVEVTRVNQKSGSIQLKIADPKELVHGNAEIIDAKGKGISNGFSSFGFNKQKTLTVNTNGPIPNGAQIQLQIVESRKTLDVPFDLKDIPLP